MTPRFDNLFSIKGKVALVTGGSRGIGEMIAAGFLAAGAKVYISARKADACNATAARLSDAYHGECISVPANLSTMDGINTVATEIASHEKQLDILVNNAGVSWGAPLDEFPESGWDKVMDTNVKAVFFMTQKMLPLLRKAGTAEDPARVINIGSVDGIENAGVRELLVRTVESGGPSFDARDGGSLGQGEHHRERDRAGSVPDLYAQYRRRRSRRRRCDRLVGGRQRQSAQARRNARRHRRARDLLELARQCIHGRRSHHV